MNLCAHIAGISPENLRDSSARTKDITDNLISVRKWGNEQTDRHTKNLILFETSVQNTKECLPKIQNDILPKTWNVTLFA